MSMNILLSDSSLFITKATTLLKREKRSSPICPKSIQLFWYCFIQNNQCSDIKGLPRWKFFPITGLSLYSTMPQVGWLK